jgi:hypothetical protein
VGWDVLKHLYTPYQVKRDWIFHPLLCEIGNEYAMLLGARTIKNTRIAFQSPALDPQPGKRIERQTGATSDVENRLEVVLTRQLLNKATIPLDRVPQVTSGV